MKETLFKCLLKFARGKRSEIHFEGKGRVADLPLPKAVKSRSLEGIYPKWPNFPKIVLSRPVGGGGGRGVENQNKTTSTQHILTVPPDYAAASPCKVQATLAMAARRAGPEAPHCAPPTHLPRPGSSSLLLPVAALATATTPLLRSPPTSNHIQARECRSPCRGKAGGRSAGAQVTCTGFL